MYSYFVAIVLFSLVIIGLANADRIESNRRYFHSESIYYEIPAPQNLQ